MWRRALTYLGLFCWLTFTHASTLLPDERNTIEVFNRISPLVVNVHNIRTVLSLSMGPYNLETGDGSGFIWDRQGHVVTNFHVIRHANKLVITLGHKQATQARVVGVDPRKDIAVLQITSKKVLKKLKTLEPLVLTDTQDLQVGQKAIAIGNPFGLDRTLTTGVISALNRQVPSIGGVTIRDMIQTDASINPGNSGGPLLNSQGQLMGMNTAIFSTSGSSAGIGFAVPANLIKRTVAQLIQHGKVPRPGIGIEVLPDPIARQLDVTGVIIKRVLPDSPAARARLQGVRRDAVGNIRLGDIIVGINDMDIKGFDDLYGALDKIGIGKSLHIKIRREGVLLTRRLKTVDLTK